jgi:hypothetical protein
MKLPSLEEQRTPYYLTSLDTILLSDVDEIHKATLDGSNNISIRPMKLPSLEEQRTPYYLTSLDTILG